MVTFCRGAGFIFLLIKINNLGNNKVSQILRYAKIIFLGRLQSYIPITVHRFFRSPLL